MPRLVSDQRETDIHFFLNEGCSEFATVYIRKDFSPQRMGVKRVCAEGFLILYANGRRPDNGKKPTKLTLINQEANAYLI